MTWDDFYEPSEFDQQVEEWKEALKKSVKKEYMDEMERLRKENAELMDIKKNWSEKIHEIDNAKEELRITLVNAEKKAKKARLSEILSPFTEQAWGYMYNFVYVREKCEKCDDEGYVHFKSPQGHDHKELCDCRKQVIRYSPVEAKIAYLSEFNSEIEAVVEFPRKANPEDRYDYCETSELYKGEDFDEIDSYKGIIFTDKSDCQRYCDYLNERKKT